MRNFGHTSGMALLEILETDLWPQAVFRYEVLSADAVHVLSRRFYASIEAAVASLWNAESQWPLDEPEPELSKQVEFES